MSIEFSGIDFRSFIEEMQIFLSIVLSGYPSIDGGQAVMNLSPEGDLSAVWIYDPEDPEHTFNDLNLQGWTPDREKIIVQSDEDDLGLAWWRANPDGTQITRLTDTLPEDHFFSDIGFRYIEENDQFRLLLRSTEPAEWLYADGFITTDSAATGHGTRVTRSGYSAKEMWSDNGVYEDSVKLLDYSDFPSFDLDTYPYFNNWSSYSPSIAPDGTKIAFLKNAEQVSSNHQLSPSGPVAGGTFTLTVGTVGNISTDFYTTIPIAWNATAATIWNALIDLPNVVDPDPSSPFNRYSGTTINASFISLQLGPKNLWMTSDNTNLTGGGVVSVDHLSNLGAGLTIPYVCNRDGSDLEGLTLQTDLSFFTLIWGPNSDILYYHGSDDDGIHYCRFYSLDPETDVSTLILDFSPVGDFGPLQSIPMISPSGNKIAYVLTDPATLFRELHVCNIDGSDDVLLYDQNYTQGDATEEQLVLGSSQNISWNWDESSICVIDRRDEAPIFLIDVQTTVATKIFDGVGWDDPDLVQYLQHPINFYII